MDMSVPARPSRQGAQPSAQPSAQQRTGEGNRIVGDDSIPATEVLQDIDPLVAFGGAGAMVVMAVTWAFGS
jgi:hypothetical protein